MGNVLVWGKTPTCLASDGNEKQLRQREEKCLNYPWLSRLVCVQCRLNRPRTFFFSEEEYYLSPDIEANPSPFLFLLAPLSFSLCLWKSFIENFYFLGLELWRWIKPKGPPSRMLHRFQLGEKKTKEQEIRNQHAENKSKAIWWRGRGRTTLFQIFS